MEDAATIAPLLREADKNEIKALSGETCQAALEYSVMSSDIVRFVSRPDGEPISIFGVGQGVPWMVGTDLMLHYGKSLVKEGRVWVREMTGIYRSLVNYVDSRNTVHVNWLKRIGFTVEPQNHYIGHDKSVPFLLFHRSN